MCNPSFLTSRIYFRYCARRFIKQVYMASICVYLPVTIIAILLDDPFVGRNDKASANKENKRLNFAGPSAGLIV